MFKKIALALALSVASLLLNAGSLSANKNNAAFLAEVIRPLQFALQTDDGDTVVGDHCTVFSASPKNHGWATAAHCVYDARNDSFRAEEFYIAGHPAELLRVDVEHDLALLQVTDGFGVKKAIKLAKSGPKAGDLLETMGYSYVWGRPFYFAGFATITEFAVFPHSNAPWFGSFGNFVAIGGQSGSPVVNEDGRLVGVLSIGFGGTGEADPIAGFTSFEVLKAFDAGWVFEK